ncbi:enolase C-terminal domain-like protein [Parapedobacter soli]|uniref:enolase C-terminal domain-like protein n=1 Tax=Parapedobacter soli TaxID=416955 RepID=UPI0021C72C6B|nr:enolase C-terminal domain-like protein [Parapedobacter soli]
MIRQITIADKRFPLSGGSGSDAVHHEPVYSFAVTRLVDDAGTEGTGLAFTLGEGNDLVCRVARYYAEQLKNKPIEEIMLSFGSRSRAFSNDPQLRWLGPHKGVVQLALASVTNACFDLWAKKRGVPLWKLLIDLEPQQLVDTLDLSYLEDVLTAEQALAMLASQRQDHEARLAIIDQGYRCYDTSVGWFGYSDEQVRENCRQALDRGFSALKLKVGSPDAARDIRRANLVREVVGADVDVMLDANQQWTLPQALTVCPQLQAMNPYWIEEPTHPDDVFAHQTLAAAIAPCKLALGEHVPNRVVFKNYLQAKCASFIQVDALRVGGVSEFIAVSLLCRKYGVPVVPHVGDMGQLHQHLVLFNHIALGHEALFLEHIPHLKQVFAEPAAVEDGFYKTPMNPGSSCDLKS